MPPGRDDFLATTVAALAKRAGYRCSKPDCRAQTSGPSADPGAAVNVGVAAHITAAASGGPRYDSSLTSEQRRDISNGIWLCQVCGKRVDADDSRFAATELRQWKAAAEAAADRELGRPLGAQSGFATLERTLVGHTNYVWDVVVTPDGRHAVSASNDHTAALWDLATGQKRFYRGAETEICSVAVSPDGKRVAGGCLDGVVLAWRIDQPDPVLRFEHGAADAKVAWLGESIVSGGRDGYLRLWGGSELLQERQAHDAAILKVICLATGAIATSSEDGTVRVWSPRDQEQIAEFAGHAGHVNSVAIAEVAQLAVTGCEDCTVTVWSLTSAERVHILQGHCDPVWRVAIDPSEQWIASGSGDNTVRLWALQDGLPVDELRHPDCVAAVAFSPDGRRLVVGCDDSKLYVYAIPGDAPQR